MKLDDFNNIDFKNAGSLPMPVKLVLLGILAIILIGLGYWFLWSPQIDELDQAKAKEQELRQTFLTKKAQAIKVDAYKQQMIDIEKTFGALLKQLPDKSQMSVSKPSICDLSGNCFNKAPKVFSMSIICCLYASTLMAWAFLVKNV